MSMNESWILCTTLGDVSPYIMDRKSIELFFDRFINMLVIVCCFHGFHLHSAIPLYMSSGSKASRRLASASRWP